MQDIITVRNPKSVGTRIDDVTIKSIDFSKSELDKSLLDYELSKSEFSKKPTSMSGVYTSFEYKLNPDLKIIKYNDLKNELLISDKTYEKFSNLDSTQNRYVSIRNSEILKFNYNSWFDFEPGKEKLKLKPFEKTSKRSIVNKITKIKYTSESAKASKVQVLESNDYPNLYTLYFKHYYALNQ